MTSASLNTGKSLSLPSAANHSPAPPPSAPPSSSFESSRRPGQAGTPQSHSAPRKGLASRKQHRSQRRPGFGQRDSDRPDDDDAMAELRAVRNASSRRGQTSITHLLNYTVPPLLGRDTYSAYSRSYRRGPGAGYHAADKARHVHANYRFVVSPAGDYTKHAADADEHLDWADVLQVVASAESQQASCPICLSEPVAPRMARCGHIFCLPCLIRFMSSSPGDDGPASERRGAVRWKKCPICEDAVYMADVRPVRFYAGQESPLPRPGDDVVLRLMVRNAGSTLALPRDSSGADMLSSGGDVPWHFAVNVLDYARIMKGTGEYMQDQYDREIDDLLRQEREDELMFHEDGEWTRKAIRAINTAKEKVKGMGEIELELSAREVAARGSQARHAAGEGDFYFYTSPPHLYLSPLDIRILKTKYGSFSAFPSTLLPRVEHISTGHVVDDALRRRARYLAHLPRGCVVGFLECDWTDIVPAETLAAFADEIERRRQRNRDKAAQEERERLQAERVEAAAIRGAARRLVGPADDDVRVNFGRSPSPDREPAVDLNDFQPLGVGGGGEGSTPPKPRTGFAPLASLDTNSSAPRTVWGTPAIPVSPELAPRRPEREPDDGWLKDDAFLDSLSAADLAAQMASLGVDTAEVGEKNLVGGAAGGGGGGGGKKKKKQKITLMSTGGRRGT